MDQWSLCFLSILYFPLVLCFLLILYFQWRPWDLSSQWLLWNLPPRALSPPSLRLPQRHPEDPSGLCPRDRWLLSVQFLLWFQWGLCPTDQWSLCFLSFLYFQLVLCLPLILYFQWRPWDLSIQWLLWNLSPRALSPPSIRFLPLFP